MAVAKLNLVEVQFLQEQYDSVLMKLIDMKGFHPEIASQFADSVQGLSVLNRENPYTDIIHRMEEVRDKYKLGIAYQEESDYHLNVIQSDTFFCDIVEEVNRIEKVKEELQVMKHENEATISQLEHMINSGLDFDRLFACHYLQIRFGRLPVKNLEKLQYYGIQEFFFKTFHQDAKEAYCMYLTTEMKAPEIDNIFSSLYFERIRIPEFVHGTPDQALQELIAENQTADQYLVALDNRIMELFNDNLAELNHIYSKAKRLDATYEAQKYVVIFGDTSAVYGFCEVKDAERIKASFEEIEDVHVEIQAPFDDARLTPPTKLKNSWFIRPFSMFVEMYGVPSYTDFDPTGLVALSYIFLFGMMFGDVGQGIVLSIVGYLAYKLKGMKLGEIGIRLGISSTIFGFIYGSYFGYEEFTTPLFHVMDSNNVMTLLGAAIGIGIVLILISIGCNIFLNIKHKHYAELICSHNGIAGLIFYIAVLALVGNMMLGLNLPVGGTFYILALIVVPVVLIFLKEPIEHAVEGKALFPHGFGGFFTTAFFEMFEIILTFVANTMSFLRVGGFVLSHAGMMLVVYTMAGMTGVGSIWYFVILVFGNIFVMCLEGMIVGIQVLRLEFYEMFSRYYEGKGRPFQEIN